MTSLLNTCCLSEHWILINDFFYIFQCPIDRLTTGDHFALVEQLVFFFLVGHFVLSQIFPSF